MRGLYLASGRCVYLSLRCQSSVPKSTSTVTTSNEQASRISTRADPVTDRFLRVDHAGEYGANRIYAGQMLILGNTEVGPVIRKMWQQEKVHLRKFDEILRDRRVRPSLLLPFWDVAGFALGAGTALLGKEAAMMCTVAVEAVISEHYEGQLRTLLNDDENELSSADSSKSQDSLHQAAPSASTAAEEEKRKAELCSIIAQFRDEELEHHDTGLAYDAEQAVLYKPLSEIIKAGCRAAIWVAERV